LLLISIAVPARLAFAQACARAAQINDTSHVLTLLRASFKPDSVASSRAWQALRSLDSTAFPSLLAVMCRALNTKVAPDEFGLPDRAGGVLSQLGEPGIRALVRGLGDSDTTLAFNAAAALDLAGEEVIDATPELLPLLADSRVQVRANAVGLVRLDGTTREAAIAAMARALNDNESVVREAAANRLSSLGRDSRPLVPSLIKALHDPVARVRREAALALGRSETLDNAAVAALSNVLLKDADASVREGAARALGWLSAGAVLGVPALIASLGDRSESVRGEAVEALGHIGADGAMERRDTILAALSATLTDRDAQVRSAAANALREIGVPAAMQHIQGLRNRDPTVRITAARALGEQPPTPGAIDALITLLRDPAPQVRAEAVSALGGFGPAVEGRMRTLLAGSDSVAKTGATQVLQYLRDVGRLPVANACFDLRLGPWKPNLGLGEDTIFSTPPKTVRFSRVTSFGFGSYNGQLSFRVLPANGARMSVHGPGFWTPIRGTDSVSMVWTTGFSGLTMKLAAAGDTLRGVAETFWDFPRPEQTSRVTGIRMPCK